MRMFCFVVMALAAAPAPADGTAMFRGDARHTGVYAATGAPQLHGVRWKFRTGGAVLSSPAVVDGIVYFGSNDGSVYAVDAASGSQKWKLATRGRVPSSPAVANGRVYVLSYDSRLYAIDAARGTVAWTFATDGERRFAARHLHGAEPAAETMPDPFDFYLSSPAVADGIVYFGSGDGHVYAVDAMTGGLKWRFRTGNVVHASPAVAGGTVYVGSWDSFLYALDAASGLEKWRFRTGEDPVTANQVGIQSSVLVAGDSVFFGCRDSKFYALDAATGRQRWAFSNGGSWVVGSAVLHDGRVHFATSDTGLLQALDAASGEPAFSLDNRRWPMFSSPAIASNVLYIGTHEGRLRAVDLATRQALWSFETDGARQHGAAYTGADGQPDYAAAYADSFYDSIVTGVQRLLGFGAVLSSPVVAGDTVYFGSADGHLYAVH